MSKIIRSLLLISAIAVLSVRAAAAAWSDTGQSTGNVFTTATLDLKLSDSDESVQDNVSVTWSGAGMIPAGTPVSGSLLVRNSGSPAADHVHFSLSNTISQAASGPGTDTANPMDKNLEITSLTYDGTNILSLISDSNGNGWKDLDDWENIAVPGIGDSDGAAVSDGTLPLTDSGSDHTLAMSVRLNANTPDTNQGDSVTTVVTATLHQAEGQ